MTEPGTALWTSPRLLLAAALCLCLDLCGLACERTNRSPLTPAKPVGPYSCIPGARVTFRATAQDSDHDMVCCRFSHGDSLTDWTSWSVPGTPCSVRLVMDDTGTVDTRAQARDAHGAESEWSDPVRVTIEDKAPDFLLPSLAGDTVRLSALLASGPVFLVWWNLHSVNSVLMVEQLQPVYDSLAARGFNLLAISLDEAVDEARVRSWAATKGWRSPVLLDPCLLSKEAYMLLIMPTGILVSVDRAIVYTHIGYRKGQADRIEAEVLKWLSTYPDTRRP